MLRTSIAQSLLFGAILGLVGWVLAVPLGGRAAHQEYRNDDDFYTLLTLAGGFLILLGFSLLLLGLVLMSVSIFKRIRKQFERTSSPEKSMVAPK